MAGSDDTGRTERQLVVFDLVPEAYGVDIGAVREIIRMQEITHVPNAPDFVEGVINLRGKVIPVIDLRKRFGMPSVEQTKESRIVVVDIAGEDIGVMVDAVTEVLRISEDTVETASSIITTADSYYILGIAKVNERLIILLDLEKTLSQRDRMALLNARTAAAQSVAPSRGEVASAAGKLERVGGI